MVVVEGKCLTRLCVFGGLCVVMWRLVHQWSFLLFWLSFDCFWLVLTIGTLLVHCWYSLGTPVTIGTPMVLTVFDDWYNVPIVKNSQKNSKNSKKWPLVYQSSHVYTESAEYTKSPTRCKKGDGMVHVGGTGWICPRRNVQIPIAPIRTMTSLWQRDVGEKMASF